MAAYKSHNLPHLVGKNYEIALAQSSAAFLPTMRDPNPRDSADFIPKFQEFIQSKADPPLEALWAYVGFFGSCDIMCKPPSFGQVSDIKDLFRLVISCSASCHPMKSIALVSPVVFYLHGFIKDLEGFQLGETKLRKIKREINALIDSVLGYINVCRDGFGGNFDGLYDLMPGWAGGHMGNLTLFYPLLNNKILERVARGIDLIDHAALAMAEAFLLKLCWKIREEGFEEKTVAELRSWIVGSVTGLRSPPFYEAILYMLLEPVWPEPASLLNLEHEDGLWKVLLDALLLVEYSFLTPDHLGQLPKKHAKHVILTKVVASYQAIELFRKCGDHAKAISHLNAFANSSFPRLLIKWVKTEVGSQLTTDEPTGSSPREYIRWLRDIENRGTKIFDDDMSDFKAAFNSSEDGGQIVRGKARPKPDTTLFYMDNKGQPELRDHDHDNDDDDDDDERINESMSAAFMTAARSLQSLEKGRRKRKTKDDGNTKQMKFVKCNAAIDQSSLLRGTSASPERDLPDIGSNRIPSSDEDM